MPRLDHRVLRSRLRLTDLPYSYGWGWLIRFGKTLEVLVFWLAQGLWIYRSRKSIIGIPSLATRNYTSIQAVVYNGTQEEVLGFRPRRLLHRILRGLPDIELFESLRFQLTVSEYAVRTVEASTETRGFVHLQVPWQLPWRAPHKSYLRILPMGVETLLGRIRLGDYDVYSAPIFFLTEKVKWIVISDIDDTIKESNVSQTTTFSQILRGIFRGNYYTYKAIEGMPELYQDIHRREALIIYLTSTPFQLAPFLLKFLREASFPEGPVFLRWLGNNRFGHKWRMLHRVLSNAEGQKVILIGDSGEQDLQIYRRMGDNPAFRDRIERILIRHVPGTPLPPLVDSRESLYANIAELRTMLDPLLSAKVI